VVKTFHPFVITIKQSRRRPVCSLSHYPGNMNRLIFLVLLATMASAGFAQNRNAIGGCEGCDLMFEGMPAAIGSSTQISPPGEKGEALVITGNIYKPDGRTPAAGVILYVYHTDAGGEYSPAPGQKDAIRHGHLRSWVKSDVQGKYKFTTIRPASYPQGRNPQHIHPLIYDPDKGYYWIDEYLFDDDPYLTPAERNSQKGRGGNGIIHLNKNAGGIWIGTRDIVLGKNVPGYW